ncbi:MAG TPA: flagellar M-ring protein FliF C-terminal domain-containing protein [Planctomycetota bacterium]|nr:flagellar M-ring protein FliF C-terminal domain-containing protein [Planctomycetota bacterium]
MRTLRDVLVLLKGSWSRLHGGQRLVVAAVLFATLAGLGGIVWFAGPGHEPATALKGNVSTHVEQVDDAETSERRLDAASRAQAIAAIAALDGVLAVNVTGGSAEFLRLQRSLGEERTRLAQQRLDQLWPGKTSVAVNVELDPTWETRSEKVLPEGAIVKSETRDFTDSSSGSTADSGQRSTSKTQKREREFVTDIGERRTGKMAPEVKRLTVAVLYDRSLEHAPGFVEQDLVNAVKAIVGWDPARDEPEAFRTLAGDFASIGPASIAAPPGIAEVLQQWGPTIGPILGLLVVVLFLRGLFPRARPPAVNGGAPAAEKVKEEDMTPEQQQEHMRAEIERSIATDPKALAKMLESWLGEQKA